MMTNRINRLASIISTLFLATSEAANLLRGTDEQGTSILVEEGRTRFFARYSDWQGRRLVQGCAKTIVNDDDDTDYTVFEGDSACLGMLQASSSVLKVEEDHPVRAFGGFSLGSYRRLLDQLPWGIEAIQADQLETGDYDVTVCVVDSGIAAGHPDFESDRVRGMDRLDRNWEWDNDRAGHGEYSLFVII
jgi:hypothetical protein